WRPRARHRAAGVVVVRVACIDIGTNSVLLLIAEQSPRGPVALVEQATITRLGQGVDRTGQLAPEACERTLACLRAYASTIAEHGAQRVVAVGTSAMRDASNGAEFRARARELLGVEPRVISGDEEASLTFAGALSGLDVTGTLVVFDVGGGSTEIIVGDRSRAGGHQGVGERVTSARSLDIGSVRLSERFLAHDPPTADECAAVRAYVTRELAGYGPIPTKKTLIGVAGTVTTLAAIDLGLEPYVAERVHGARISAERVREIATQLASLSTTERKRLPGLAPDRADVIVAGALLVHEVLMWAQCEELVASDRGVRWGLAARELAP
ncbi:MAG TPA: Ppx/GppA phosphatase family protein, partial [Polyangiaceae bacterium]|nr:Ppx/GppA phosphatase family protein [Polyangiaceae bacterium]